jgi:DNA-binding response OmpR family regulator
MPGMNGTRTIEAARALRPGLAALYVTGHAEGSGLALATGDGLLRKPFRLSELARRVSDTLARAPSARTTKEANVVPLAPGRR